METMEENDHVSKDELPEKCEYEVRGIQRYEYNELVRPKYINLKNEMVFADYNLSASESRLLYFAMAHFDKSEFYAERDTSINEGKKSDLRSSEYSIIYEDSKSRTIIIPATMLMKAIRCSKSNSQSKNYKPLYNTISQISSATITLNTKNSSKESDDKISFFEKIEVFRQEGASGKGQILVMLTFSVSYMPFVICSSGFTKLPFDSITGLSSPYAMRYYHWFLYALKKVNATRFSISIREMRKRFRFDDGMYLSHFETRFIAKPIKDIMEKTDIEVYVEELQRNSNTKRRTKISVASFNISVIPKNISLSE